MEQHDQQAVFLRQQAEILTRALRSPGDPRALAQACAAHEDCHDRWLELVAAAGPAGEAVADLYTLHGRLLESLERGLEGWFSPEAAREVRLVLAERLKQRTDLVVTSVLALPSPV